MAHHMTSTTCMQAAGWDWMMMRGVRPRDEMTGAGHAQHSKEATIACGLERFHFISGPACPLPLPAWGSPWPQCLPASFATVPECSCSGFVFILVDFRSFSLCSSTSVVPQPRALWSSIQYLQLQVTPNVVHLVLIVQVQNPMYFTFWLQKNNCRALEKSSFRWNLAFNNTDLLWEKDHLTSFFEGEHVTLNKLELCLLQFPMLDRLTTLLVPRGWTNRQD